MARLSAPAYPSASTRRLWPTAFILTLVTLTVPVPILALGGRSASPASSGTSASPAIPVALACGVAGLLVFALLARLRSRHLAAESEVARLRGEHREREAEAARREAHWHVYVKGRIELVREEIEYVVKNRLPAALTGAEIPLALHSGDQLGDGVAEVLDHLLTEVAEAADDREESHRLALVELASRVQTSAHRIQAAAMGLADRYPSDSDLLAATMQVDHAATQQARHAQSLKVLCNEWPGQQWQKPLALVDVVRAASGRIVAYRRIEVTGDPDVGVTPSVVEPLIHLMAELLANATEYSPPKTVVPVTVRTVQRGAVIEVDDGGLGLDEYRLSELREVVSGRRLLGVGDVGEIPQTGFAVVGRFAHRHGFNVDLSPSPYGGVRAVVLVPVEILETLDPAGLPLSRRSAGPRSNAVSAPRRPGIAGPAAAEPVTVTHHRPVPEPVAPAPSFHELSPRCRPCPSPPSAGSEPSRCLVRVLVR